MKTHKDGTSPDKGVVFVFGSNLAGRHGAGAAREAYEKFGADMGCGSGRMGMSYGIPTKDFRLNVMPLEQIKLYVDEFVDHALARPSETFFITRVGCGLAGYRDDQIAPMFVRIGENVDLPDAWVPIIKRERKAVQK